MNDKKRALILFIALLAALTVAVAESPSGWSQWRGDARDGSVPGSGWPGDFSGLEPLWRVELGKGYPGPIVAADRVFVVETVDKSTVAVRALDRESGEELWATRWPGKGSVPFFAASNGDWVRSTPAWDGKTLYVGDMSEVLMALDGESGKELWRIDFPARYETKVPDFGFASSPMLAGDDLYVQAANSLIKLNKKTGEPVWRALAGSGSIMSGGAFSSPVMAKIGGVEQVVTLTREALYGVDPGSGDVLWRKEVPSFRGMHIQTPVVVDDTVFTSPYKQRSYLYSVKREGESMKVDPSWENKATGYMSSPVVIDGHLYMHLGNGRVECMDLSSGESRWRSESMGKYWSMIWQDDKILGLSEVGTLYLLRADPEAFELLDSKEVAEQETWGHVAVAGDQIFVRELKGISAFRWN